MKKRVKLVQARLEKNWTIEEAAEQLECTPNTLGRWERGEMFPSARNVSRLCKIYGKEAAELDLVEDEVAYPPLQSKSARYLLRHLDRDLTMHLMEIALTPHYTYQDVMNKTSHVIEEWRAMNTEQAELTRREALQRLVKFPLLLSLSERIRSVEGDLKLYGAAITACSYLRNGGLEDMRVAFNAISSYVPPLDTIVRGSSQHRKAAAVLASQALKMKSRLAYHFESIKQAIHYAEYAVIYARESQNNIALMLALRNLTSAYEWIKGPQRLQGLSFAEEAVHLMQIKQKQGVPLQSLIYTGLAKQQSLSGMKQETLASIGKARDHFSDAPPIPGVDGSGYKRAGLLRDTGLAYAYLGQHDNAFKTFGEIIDLDERNFPSEFPMAARTRLEILKVTTIASLKLPANQKDKLRSIAIWKATVKAAQELQSETYLNESYMAYQIMEAMWPDDAEIRDFRDMIGR